MQNHDVVIIGGGHNGLVVAAYLAKAGLDVCVVERQDKVGGGVVTREVTLPGFKHDICSIVHMNIRANPLLHQDELGLISKYGLEYIVPDIQSAFIFPDDRALIVYRDIVRTCESIRQFSERDAEVYPKFCEAAKQIFKAGKVASFSPIPDFGNMVSLLDSSKGGREYWRALMSSGLEIAEEWFQSDHMKVAVIRWICEILSRPSEKGTGLNALGFHSIHTWGVAIPQGGSGVLSETLLNCIEDNGGTVKVSSPVNAVTVEAGKAKGVTLDSGEEIVAKEAIVSNLNVKQLFLDMLKPDDLPDSFTEHVRRIRQGNLSVLHQVMALNEAPKYKAGGDAGFACIQYIVPPMEDLIRAFDDCYYGIPFASTPFIATPTVYDTYRAPEGKHTLYLAHIEPYHLRDGDPDRWDEIKEEMADRVLETIQEHTVNMGADNILGRWIGSPLDYYNYNPAWIKGDYNHFPTSLTQICGNRPLPGWGRFKTPVKKLYICGASAHPGGGVWGSGRATVQVIMEELGVDFNKVISK